MSGCCDHDAKFDGVSQDYKRRLWLVIVINALMFVVEMGAGRLAQSQALQADALDFLGDALTYGLSMAVIGASVTVRTNAALFKGISLLVVGTWVFGSTVYRVFYGGVPAAEIMGWVGFLALVANCVSALVNHLQGRRRQRSFCLALFAQRRYRKHRSIVGSSWCLGNGQRLARSDRCRDHGQSVSVFRLPDHQASFRRATRSE